MTVASDGTARGRKIGTVLRTKHYFTLPSMLQQLESARVNRNWTMDRFDFEAGYAPGYYQSIITSCRSIRMVTLSAYAKALGKEWKLS